MTKKISKRRYVAQNHSLIQETRTADQFGGYQTLGSGSKGMKGDVRIPGVARIENKCTSKKSFSITREMVQKLNNYSLGYGELPIIQVDFINQDGVVLEQVAIMPQKLLESVISVKTAEKD